MNNGASIMTEDLLTLTVDLQAMIADHRTWMISDLLAMLTDARLMIVVSILIMTVVRYLKRVAFRIVPSQDMPTQEPRVANGSERRLSVSQAMKTGGPTPAPLASSSATLTSTTGTAAHALTPAPVDSAAVSVHSSPAPMSVDGQRKSNARFVDERSSTQVASSQGRVSGTQPQLVPRAEPTRPGVLLSSKPPENTGIATVVDDLPHARVSEPPHPDRFSISAAPVTVTTAAPPSAAAADDRLRPVSAAASHGLSVGREKSRHQPPPPPPRASSPSSVQCAHPSLSLHARAREPSTVRSYFRPEVSRPSEDDRHLDMHHLPPPPPPPPPAGDSYRRYDERSRWSPPPPPTYADRCGHYDRDRDRDRYWENNNNNKGYRSPPPPRDCDRDRDRDRPFAPQPPPRHRTGTALGAQLDTQKRLMRPIDGSLTTATAVIITRGGTHRHRHHPCLHHRS